MIVITAPTSNIGRHVVEQLMASGADIRVIARDPARLPAEVAKRAEIVQGSHGDADVMNKALEGASALFWLAPGEVHKTPDQAYVDFTRPAADAVRREAVPRVVSITALGRGTEWQDEAGLVTASLRMDDLLMATGAAFRGLAMPSFMDNTLRSLASIRDDGVMVAAYRPDIKAPKTAARDMGAAAARLLADDSWTGQHDVPLLGPEDLSMDEMAAIISDVLGKEVRYRQVPYDMFQQRMVAGGASPAFAQASVDMFKAKDAGMDNVVKRADAEHAPTSFRTWCEEELKPRI